VIVGFMLEPTPGAAIGLIAVTLVSVFCEWVF
jgi:L-tartrate/succinate antiporter